jgi:hypothetical protein
MVMGAMNVVQMNFDVALMEGHYFFEYIDGSPMIRRVRAMGRENM